MSFNLDAAISDLVIDFPEPRVFLDRLVSLMFFSGLRVAQQLTSDRFGIGAGIAGSAGAGNRGLLLVSPISAGAGNPTITPPLLMQKAFRLDVITKIWVASRLLSELSTLRIVVAGYRLDPLGNSLASMMNELITPNSPPLSTIMYADGFHQPYKVIFRPASVSLYTPLAMDKPLKDHKFFIVTLSNRTRLTYSTLLKRIHSLQQKYNMGLTDLKLGGWDRSRIKFASLGLVVPKEIAPTWPKQWHVKELRNKQTHQILRPEATSLALHHLNAFGLDEVTPVFLQATTDGIEAVYTLPPDRVKKLVTIAKSHGVQATKVELYSQDQSPIHKKHKPPLPGTTSFFHSSNTWVYSPPKELLQDPTDRTREWAIKLLSFIKDLYRQN